MLDIKVLLPGNYFQQISQFVLKVRMSVCLLYKSGIKLDSVAIQQFKNSRE